MTKTYIKHNSFNQIYSSKALFFEKIKKKILTLINESVVSYNFPEDEKKILKKIATDLNEQKNIDNHQGMKFSIKHAAVLTTLSTKALRA